MNIQHQKTVEILKWFEALNRIPRGSKNEAAIQKWLLDWAADHDFEAEQDKVGNVVIRVPGSAGGENSEPVVIQGHMDMVCEKTKDSNHDFEKDPIVSVYNGEWLKADRTTLGADNGIAIAIGMVASMDKNLKRPPLELLFTVDEEEGMTGALGIEPGLVKGQRLLNIDTEEEGVLTVGCAGGVTGYHRFPFTPEPVPSGLASFSIDVGGLSGGHSADIHHEKANGLKVLARTMDALNKKYQFYIADLKGGSASNAIARSAGTVIFMDHNEAAAANEIVNQVAVVVAKEFKNTDPNLHIKFAAASKIECTHVMPLESTKNTITMMLAMPHGIYAMSTEVENSVETSNNFSSIYIEDNCVCTVTLQRSAIDSRLDDITAHINAVVKLAGGTSVNGDRFSGWPANKQSKLLELCTAIYEKINGRKPIVENTHGGLECGVIGTKLPGMDMISFGPTIHHPHSPDECIHVPSIGNVWDFTEALLEALC